MVVKNLSGAKTESPVVVAVVVVVDVAAAVVVVDVDAAVVVVVPSFFLNWLRT